MTDVYHQFDDMRDAEAVECRREALREALALALVEAAPHPIGNAGAIADLVFPADRDEASRADVCHAMEGDINACFSLIEREMPSWRVQLFENFDDGGSYWNARLISPRHHLFSTDKDDPGPRSPARALLVAFLRSKLAEAERQETDTIV